MVFILKLSQKLPFLPTVCGLIFHLQNGVYPRSVAVRLGTAVGLTNHSGQHGGTVCHAGLDPASRNRRGFDLLVFTENIIVFEEVERETLFSYPSKVTNSISRDFKNLIFESASGNGYINAIAYRFSQQRHRDR